MCLAVPGKILAIQGGEGLWRTGRIDFGGVVKEVNLACVPEVVTGSTGKNTLRATSAERRRRRIRERQ